MKSDDQEKYELFEAAKRGDSNRIAELITNGVDVNSKDKDGFTAIHFASGNDRTESIKKLISLKADLSAKDRWGFTALHAAADSSHVESVKVLIEHGADIHAKNNFGQTPLNSSIKAHKETTIGHDGQIHETRHQQKRHPYIGNDKEVIQKMLKECEVAAELIKGGANLNVKDSLDKTPGWKIFMYDRQSVIAKHLVTEKEKTPAIINNMIKQASGHVHDSVKTWMFVEKVVKEIPAPYKVEVVSKALENIDNPSRQKRLLKLLSEKDQDKLLEAHPNIMKATRLEKMQQKLLSFMKRHNVINKSHHGHNHHKSKANSKGIEMTNR